MRRMILSGCLLSLLLCSCGSAQYQSADPTLRRKAADIDILTREQIAGRSYETLTEVRSMSCARQLGSSPSMDAAKDMLRINAAKVGGEGLVKVLCEETGISFSSNCWKAIRCAGDAIRWTSPSAGAAEVL